MPQANLKQAWRVAAAPCTPSFLSPFAASALGSWRTTYLARRNDMPRMPFSSLSEATVSHPAPNMDVPQGWQAPVPARAQTDAVGYGPVQQRNIVYSVWYIQYSTAVGTRTHYDCVAHDTKVAGRRARLWRKEKKKQGRERKPEAGRKPLPVVGCLGGRATHRPESRQADRPVIALGALSHCRVYCSTVLCCIRWQSRVYDSTNVAPGPLQ